MTALIDTYRCLPWGGDANYGGDAQGPVGKFVKRNSNHKITLPEVKWLAKELLNFSNAVGLLITDDGVDMARNEVEEVEWMLDNTPELLPWVNQCGDGTEWLARAGTPYAVPELYSVNPPVGANVSTVEKQCAAQLDGYESWTVKSGRFGLRNFPLVNIGDGGDTGLLRSSSLVRFQGYSAIAYGAKGMMWYCWGNGAWNLTTQEPTPIYSTLSEVNWKLRKWSNTILDFPSFWGAYHTGFAGPTATSREPGATELVTAMSDALLAGVLGKQECSGKECELLLVVVDKRVSPELDAAPGRDVKITLSSSVASVEFPGAESDTAVYNAQDHSVTLKLGAGGDGVSHVFVFYCLRFLLLLLVLVLSLLFLQHLLIVICPRPLSSLGEAKACSSPRRRCLNGATTCRLRPSIRAGRRNFPSTTTATRTEKALAS